MSRVNVLTIEGLAAASCSAVAPPRECNRVTCTELLPIFVSDQFGHGASVVGRSSNPQRRARASDRIPVDPEQCN